MVAEAQIVADRIVGIIATSADRIQKSIPLEYFAILAESALQCGRTSFVHPKMDEHSWPT
jgi:hypothetical protein